MLHFDFFQIHQVLKNHKERVIVVLEIAGSLSFGFRKSTLLHYILIQNKIKSKKFKNINKEE